MDCCGAVSRSFYIREMANILFAKYGDQLIQTIGEKWIYNFIQ